MNYIEQRMVEIGEQLERALVAAKLCSKEEAVKIAREQFLPLIEKHWNSMVKKAAEGAAQDIRKRFGVE